MHIQKQGLVLATRWNLTNVVSPFMSGVFSVAYARQDARHPGASSNWEQCIWGVKMSSHLTRHPYDVYVNPGCGVSMLTTSQEAHLKAAI